MEQVVKISLTFTAILIAITLIIHFSFPGLFGVHSEEIGPIFSERYNELQNKGYLSEEERAEYEKEYQKGLDKLEELRDRQLSL